MISTAISHHPLRAYRLQNDLSLADIAGVLGVTRQQLHRIETGQRTLTPRLAIAIEEELGISRHLLRPDLWDKPTRRRSKAA
jgi:transcriptional regulator with XRE-family HTH domain